MNAYRRKLLLIAILNIFCLVWSQKKDFTEDYCDASLCKNLQHVACKAKVKSFGKECSIDAYVVPMDSELSNYLVTVMNFMRNKVAGGDFNSFPSATRMTSLHWHEELAYLAEMNIRKCHLNRDACRNTKQFPNVGQAVGYRGLKGKPTNINDIMQAQIRMWFEEHKLVTLRDVMNYKKHPGKPTTNFMQLIYENATDVGCAVLQQSSNSWLQTFLTCNFAHSPVEGHALYKFGRAAEDCKSGEDELYENLCDVSAIEDKKATKPTQAARTAKKLPKVQTRTGNETALISDDKNSKLTSHVENQRGVLDMVKDIFRDKFRKITGFHENMARQLEEGSAHTSQEETQVTKSPATIRKELDNRFEHFLSVLKKSVNANNNITIITSYHEVDIDPIPTDSNENGMRRMGGSTSTGKLQRAIAKLRRQERNRASIITHTN